MDDEQVDETEQTGGAEGAEQEQTDKVDDKPADTDAPDTRRESEKRLDALLENLDTATDGETDDEKPTESDDETDEEEKPAESDDETDDKGEGAEDLDDDEPVTLKLPGRKADDEDLELPLDRKALAAAGLDPQAVQERFAQLRNGYGRRQEVEADRRAMRLQEEKISSFRAELRERPVDFMVDEVPAEQHVAIVEALLARLDGDAFTKVVEKVASYEQDPITRERESMKLEREAGKRKNERAAAEQTAKAKAEYTNSIAEQIMGLVPDEMEEAVANEFYDFAAHKLQLWAKDQPKGTSLKAEDVPKLLVKLGALKPYGLALPDPAAKGRKTGGRTPKAPVAGKKVAAAPAGKAVNTGKDLKQRIARRRIAVVAPAGAGATASSTRPPKGQTWKERSAWLDKLAGIGKK